MVQDLSYAILGTGALGGFYGAKLQQAGLDVHFLLHRDYDHVKQHGLVIASCLGDFTLPQVQSYEDVREMPRCDVVIVALKTTQNHLLPHLLPHVVKPDGVVLVLQNGINIEPEIAKIVGSTQVLGGVCAICTNKIAAGHIRHLDYGEIAIAAYAPRYQPTGITAIMTQIAHDFEQTGLPVDLIPNLLLARWRKLVWNIPFNGLSVVLNAKTNELIANPETYDLARNLMQEVVNAANAYNCQIPDEFIAQMLDYTAKMKPYSPSMKIDYNEKRSLEIEAIYGNSLRMAKSAGVSMPKVAKLYRHLNFLSGTLISPHPPTPSPLVGEGEKVS